MKKIALLLTSLFLSFHFLHAQVTDSLLQLLPSTTDTTRVQVLNMLCYEMAYSEPDKGKQFGHEGLQTARAIHYALGEAKALMRLGIIYDVTGNYDSAVYCYQHAGVIYDKTQNLKGKASSLNNIGMLYAAKGNFSRALGNYYTALRIFEQIKDEGYLSNVYNNIGIVYADMYKHKPALAYFSKAAANYQRLGNTKALASAYTNMGRAYDDLDKPDSALYYFGKSVTLEKAANNVYGLGILYNNIALVYRSLKQPQKSLEYLYEALRIKRELNDQTGEASTLLNIAGEYMYMKNDALFEKYALESHNLAAELKSYRIMRKTSWVLMDLYSKKGDYKKAVEYARLMAIVRDSVLNDESTKQIAELEVKYESEKQALEIDKANLALSNAQLEIAHNRNTILLMLIGGVLVAIVGFGLYKRHRHLQQRTFDAELLREQEHRNKAIIEAEEKERIRIARELHDGIGQQLSAAKMNLSAFESKIDDADKNGYALLVQLVDDAVKEVRSVSHNMMPNALIRSGLVSAVRDFVHKLSTTDALKVDLQIVGLNQRLNNTTEAILYRVLQECVSNIVKHAQASHISIQLIQHEHHLNMLIEDNGKGFDTTNINQVEGIGLKNMLSRVQFLNGTIEFDSTQGKGTTIIIDVPLGA